MSVRKHPAAPAEKDNAPAAADEAAEQTDRASTVSERLDAPAAKQDDRSTTTAATPPLVPASPDPAYRVLCGRLLTGDGEFITGAKLDLPEAEAAPLLDRELIERV